MMEDYLGNCQNVTISILAPLSDWLVLCEQSQIFVWRPGERNSGTPVSCPVGHPNTALPM